MLKQRLTTQFVSFFSFLVLLFALPISNVFAEWGASERIDGAGNGGAGGPLPEGFEPYDLTSLQLTLGNNGNGHAFWTGWNYVINPSGLAYSWVYGPFKSEYVTHEWRSQGSLFEGTYLYDYSITAKNGAAQLIFNWDCTNRYTEGSCVILSGNSYAPDGTQKYNTFRSNEGCPPGGNDFPDDDYCDPALSSAGVTNIVMNDHGQAAYALDTETVFIFNLTTGWKETSLRQDTDKEKLSNIKLAINDAGAVSALWKEESSETDGYFDLKMSRFQAESGWSSPQIVESTKASIRPLDIKIDELGNAIVIWSRQHPKNSNSVRIYANHYESENWLGSGVVVWNAVKNSTTLSMDKLGNAYLKWSRRLVDGTDRISIKRYAASSGWNSRPISLWTKQINFTTNDIKLVNDAQGNAVVAWGLPDGKLQVRRFDASKNYWRQPLSLRQTEDVSSNYDKGFSLVSNDTGVVSIAYLGNNPSGTGLAVYIRRFDGENRANLSWNWGRRAWTEPTRLDENTGVANQPPELATNSRGDIMAGWFENSNTEVWVNNFRSESDPASISIQNYKDKFPAKNSSIKIEK